MTHTGRYWSKTSTFDHRRQGQNRNRHAQRDPETFSEVGHHVSVMISALVAFVRLAFFVIFLLAGAVLVWITSHVFVGIFFCLASLSFQISSSLIIFFKVSAEIRSLCRSASSRFLSMCFEMPFILTMVGMLRQHRIYCNNS